MLDAHIRPLINPPLDYLGGYFAKRGISANDVTALGFLVGMAAVPLIIYGSYALAILCILANRLFDGIDGSIARSTKISDFGSVLDIVCDFTFYASVVFAFAFTHPTYAFWAAFVILSFIGATSSFLSYAIIAAKENRQTAKRGIKSFYHLGGICEGAETTIFLILICLFPDLFSELCLGYGILCWLTTIGRVYAAWTDFGQS